MIRHPYTTLLGVAVATAGIVACQPFTGMNQTAGGELGMQVKWPMRVMAIPPDTAVIVTAVFRDGSFVATGGYRVGIVGRGAGAIVYRGLANGSYQVVAGAYDRQGRALAGGSGAGAIDTKVSPRTQVSVSLSPGGAPGELAPFQADILRYLEGLPKPVESPSPVPSAGEPTPPPSTPPSNSSAPPTTTETPAPTSTATPAAESTTAPGGGGGTIAAPSTTSTVGFTGGFQ
jgi:hypothetical protein